MSSEFPKYVVKTRRERLPLLQEWWAAFRNAMWEYLVGANIIIELDGATSDTLDAMANATNEEVKRIKEIMSKQAEEQLKGQINNIPPCILSCLYDRFLINGCTYNNYFCFCSQMTSTLLEEKVQSCMKGCPYNEERIYAKTAIVDFCEVHGDEDLHVLFPWFLIEHESNKRAVSSGVPPPAPTIYVTETSTASWGVAPYTITQPESGGTVTVIEYAEDTDVLTTFFTTTTIPSGQAPYTSIFTDQVSAAITEVIGVHQGSKPSSSSSPGSDTNPDNPSSANSSGGLSSGAKIGIGVAIPLAFIAVAAVGLIWFLRRRKNRREVQSGPQTHDGGLPEPTSTIAVVEEPKDLPPSYHGLHVEAGGSPIAEMSQDQHPTSTPEPALNTSQQRYEAGGVAMPRGQELSADQARYEASGDPVYAGHELSTQPMTPSPTPASPVSSPTRKPVPLATASPGPSSSFPPPWDSSGATEYERDLNIGPAEAAAAEDQELKELEEEVARVKMQKQRLQELQALEAREDELRRSIAERKKLGKKT